jgi:hypothetical protein
MTKRERAIGDVVLNLCWDKYGSLPWEVRCAAPRGAANWPFPLEVWVDVDIPALLIVDRYENLAQLQRAAKESLPR